MGQAELFDFVAIDFETATNQLDSACAVGLAAVRDREIIETEYSLIKPPELKFLKENINVHGITPDMVVDSPAFDDLWNDRLKKYFGHSLVIAHNARFDMSVLKESLVYSDCPDFKYVDSVSIARDFVPGKKTLAHCAEHLQIDMGQHHNALNDAITCAKIVLKCLDVSGLKNIGQLCFSMDNITIHNFSDLLSDKSMIKKPKQKHSYPTYSVVDYTSVKEIKAKTDKFDETHPFYQKNIVFTGIPPMGRREAMQAVADCGGILKESISGKVDYLISGESPYPDQPKESRKEKKAMELNQAGKGHIQILNGEEFLRLLKNEQ